MSTPAKRKVQFATPSSKKARLDLAKKLPIIECRKGIRNIQIKGEAASADEEAANNLPFKILLCLNNAPVKGHSTILSIYIKSHQGYLKETEY